MDWEIVIGLETHAQLSTRSKIFSRSSTRFGAEPNTQANAVDMALPGSLPAMNRGAVERAIQFGLAVGARVAERSVFARKNYFYPDLPKNYQISQFELPIVVGGQLSFFVGEQEHTVRLTRAHLEEDAGKSLHEHFTGPHGESSSGIDLNRAGTPLLEIVSEPEMRSAAEAVAYARTLHGLVVWLGICDGNMQEGSFRCDANVSVRPRGQAEFGTRCEIKNLNSFRFLERAIQYEARRQIELIEDGGRVVQETRLYDADRDETRSMRTKEDSDDYRYFPDPDLPPLVVAPDWIEQVRQAMPELPAAKRARFEADLGLSAYDAAQLTLHRATADYFEAAAAALPADQAKQAANWILGELSAALNRDGLDIGASPVSPRRLAALIARVLDGTISTKIARDVFAAMWTGESGGDPDTIIESRGLRQISDTGAIEAMIDTVLAANPAIVEEYRAGKQKAFNSLVGQVMKAAKGKANPQQVNEILKRKLDS
ncbi:Asp-tRNA(Asn)/Glu-tRNA(Gln) amidotransferase subunit GatB [Castellaniella defragrans]|uniref:Aspartyl/glutamyl-tRNA(Asn/Gln) amidotransferase subunit B n=1 Tax=Castellaniella defragrans TaxID=75697 RepID=A0A7W9TSE6_CASDE|nr:Asp-tRNA(Asn)/Glu-tRNA(Gln) amidotransferase subunit GatB [Castellaniella defragrans]KAB0615667.1 Asp-tRNA(Asn)/Glu-tRNA(Gln) amidotransferase subunit GatB [Castellaniella defragrans]MBB6084677.1 aspartyl-tRNA(Asn)/glutamyl-tRNA(Gln) amidotransferase subunit B [Castellaniella defragrans]